MKSDARKEIENLRAAGNYLMGTLSSLEKMFYSLDLLWGLPLHGTAPLTGERAQRDFPRPSSWTLGHVGIRQRPGTGTPSWTFGQGGFCHKLPRRTPSSLRLDPRRGSDLVPEQFGETPEMVGQTTGHSWRLSQGPLGFSHCSLAEGLMETAKVVGTPNQVHACLKGLEPMSGMATLAR